MWVFFNDAFLSIVEYNDDPDFLLVRARSEGDIERVFPEAEVSKTPDADYLYRTVLRRAEVAAAIAQRALDINYPNFKNSIKNPPYRTACADIWSVMYGYQRVMEHIYGKGKK